MSAATPNDAAKPGKINLQEEIAHSEWKTDPIIGFEQRASLAIAQWVLIIFGGVYVLAFTGAFILFFKADTTFEKAPSLSGSRSIRFSRS